MTIKDIQRRIASKQDHVKALQTRIKNDEKRIAELKVLLARARSADWSRFMAANESTIHYSQARPTPQYSPGTKVMTLDCSGMAETIARWSGLPDPSGEGWGYGNTDTMLKVLKPIRRGETQPGDYVLWHNGTDGLHVAVIVKRTSSDILICSHGQEADPRLFWLSSYVHEGTRTFLGAVT